MGAASFSWRNYSKNTPQVYLRLAKLLKRILYGLATGSVILRSEEWISVITILLIPAVEEAVQFFADASEDANIVKVEAEVGKDTIVVEPKV